MARSQRKLVFLLYKDEKIKKPAALLLRKRHPEAVLTEKEYWLGGSFGQSPVAVEARERIGALYPVESDIQGRSPEERREIRNTRSRPLLDSLKQWLEETLLKHSRKSDTAMAVRYALGRWEALMRYCDDGHFEIDNNAADPAFRAAALGRKRLSLRRIGSRW